MTTFLLLRHAAHELPSDVLAGRLEGVHLSSQGRVDARRLAQRLAPDPVHAVYSSPRDRAHETAEMVAAPHAVAVSVSEPLEELDYGEWTGRSFGDLAGDRRWAEWNASRSTTSPPGGESMTHVQERVVRELAIIRERHPSRTVAVVSHADVLKAALMHYLGMSLDLFLRIRIDPGSLTVVEVETDAPPVVHCMNDTSHLAGSRPSENA